MMTEEQVRAHWEQQQRQQAEFMNAVQRQQAEQMAMQILMREKAMWQQQVQLEINELPRQQYRCIVAVDERGAFSKDGKIPWTYTEDFKWFKMKTEGGICVMGRTTYDSIVSHLGDKAADSVLPNRKCFVVTSTPLPLNNATAIPSIAVLDSFLSPDDVNTPVFFCGGEQIYSEGIAKCQELLITVVNKDVDGDKFFPVSYVLKHFELAKVMKTPEVEDLLFTVWIRK